MFFTKLFGLWGKRVDSVAELKERLIRMEAELGLFVQFTKEQAEKGSGIVIEKLNVEKICVDKVEYHSNFGALGIKELKGKLNIGANYGVAMPWPDKEEVTDDVEGDFGSVPAEKGEKTKRESKDSVATREQGPRYRIQGKDI